MKIGLIGSTGKMGQAVLKIAERKGIAVLPYIRTGTILSKEEMYRNSTVIIDFSVAEAAGENFHLSEKYGKPILIGTTGHVNLTQFHHPKVPVLYAPNTCIEWLLIKNLIKNLTNTNTNFSISIDDIHSETKRDAPSGTAKDLMEQIMHPSLNTKSPWSYESSSAETKSAIRSIRGPNVASWHRISLMDHDQVINIDHQVLNRSIYASGAIKLAEKLVGKTPGFYLIEDLF